MVKRFKEWKKKYKVLEEYYNTHGNIDLPYRYTIGDIDYYQWLHNMRIQYKTGQLDKIKIDLLEKLGMKWDLNHDKWNSIFKIAKKYYEIYGHLRVSQDCLFEGIYLYRWLGAQRRLKAKNMLSQEKIDALNSIGMSWVLYGDTWNYKYNLAKQYYKKYGNLKVPQLYVVDGVNLGLWLKHLRKVKNKLPDDKIKALDAIGMNWDSSANPKQSWDKSYEMLKDYYNTYGNIDVIFEYKVGEFCLGHWLSYQRNLYHQGILKQDRIDKLNELHINWNLMFSKSFDKKLTAEKLALVRSKLELHLYKRLDSLNQDDKFSDSDILQRVEEIFIRKLQ